MIWKSLFLAVLLAALSAAAQAQGRSEFYAAPVFTDSKNYTFEGGTNVRTDTGWGFTVGFAHVFNPKLTGAIELEWTTNDYTATIQPGGTITVQVANAARVPVTGLCTATGVK